MSGTGSLLQGAPSLRRRRRVNRAMEGLSSLAALVAVAALGLLVGYVISKGAGALSIGLLTKIPAGFGETGGGIANALVGTAILIGLAAACAAPAGVLVAVATAELAPPRLAAAVGFALDVLAGVPTIIVGLVVFGVMVAGHRQSGLAGAVALAVIMLPIVARAAHESLLLVPRSLREAALALGIARWRTTVSVVLPAAAGAIVNAVLLAIARVAGETAPLLFTSSIFAQTVSTDVTRSLPSIPVTIFTYSESPSPDLHAQAWAAALVLVAFVLALSVLARLVAGRLDPYRRTR